MASLDFSSYWSAANSPERSQAPPWKFWRKLSTRRTDKKPPRSSAAKYSSGTRRGEWTHPSHLDLRPPSCNGDPGPVTSGSLPDVVDKAVFRRSSSLKAPPKPPRLFLFRSSSISHTRSSLDGGSARSSVVGSGSRVDVVADAEPIYVNAAFGAALNTGLSTNDRILPPTVSNNNNNNDAKDDQRMKKEAEMEVVKNQAPVHKPGQNENPVPVSKPGQNECQVPVSKPVHNGTLPRTPKASASPPTTAPNYHTLPNRPAHRVKATSDKRNSSRARRKSSEKSESSRHKHIMHSVVDLLCQRFDPFPLLGPLQSAGILTPLDVKAFQGHPDRKLICESVAGCVGAGDYARFSAFIEVVRQGGGQEEIVRVLDAMRAVDCLIHDVPAPPGAAQDDDAQVLADEKMISYEVGYLAPDGLTLKPVVELERVRPADRRISKRVSSMCISASDSDLAKRVEMNGGSPVVSSAPVMLNVCVTGHNLGGQRALLLAEAIRTHPCLLELRIGKTQLHSADLVAICQALNHNASITSLDIRLNALDFVGASAVAQLLSRTRALRQLNLSSTGLDAASCRAVLSAVAANKTLSDADLSFLDVGDAVCESVRDVLRANSCLQRLRLRSNNFSAAGCFTIAEGLNRNRSLLELDLSRNCIGDEGIQALARYVPESSLMELSLENCGVTSEGCGGLAEMIAGSKRLRWLDLSVNFLGDVGVKRLAASLERSSVLTTVGLNMCGITNDGFSALLDVLEKNASISLLKLCYNRLGREFHNPAATSDNLRYRLRIVTSSKPKLKILLWGNSFDEN